MQNQPDILEQSVASPIAEVQPPFSRPAPSQERKPLSRANLVSLPLMFAFIGCIIGGSIGMIQYNQCSRGYESQAIFRVTPISATESESPTPHAILASSRLMIEQCLNRDGGKLKNLPSFDLTAEEDIPELVRRNLVVETLSDDGSVVSMKLITSSPLDSAAFLNNLVHTYEESIVRREDQLRRTELLALRERSAELRAKHSNYQRKMDDLKSQEYTVTKFSALAIDSSKRINATRLALREKLHWLKLVEESIEGDEDKQTNMIWILKELGYLNSEPSEKDLKPVDLLKRCKAFIDAKIALDMDSIVKDEKEWLLFDTEANRTELLSNEREDTRDQLRKSQGMLDSLNSEIWMLDSSQKSSVYFQRLENGTDQYTMTTRGSLSLVWIPVLIGLFSGLMFGSLFAVTLK